jgi:hypothetical protein
MERISIYEFKINRLKQYYGASKKVYRQSHVEKLLRMWNDLHHLSELSTRTRLAPCNEEFLNKKAIASYNSTLERLQEKYPDIKEFHNYKPICK